MRQRILFCIFIYFIFNRLSAKLEGIVVYALDAMPLFKNKGIYSMKSLLPACILYCTGGLVMT